MFFFCTPRYLKWHTKIQRLQNTPSTSSKASSIVFPVLFFNLSVYSLSFVATYISQLLSEPDAFQDLSEIALTQQNIFIVTEALAESGKLSARLRWWDIIFRWLVLDHHCVPQIQATGHLSRLHRTLVYACYISWILELWVTGRSSFSYPTLLWFAVFAGLAFQ